MKTSNKIWLVALFAIGICLLAGGVYGFCSLADAADDYLSATGVIDRVDSRKTYGSRAARGYRGRRIRVENTVSVRYETTLYGEFYATLDFYVPFLMKEGDKIDILYNPRLPRNIRVPGWESLFYALLLTFGLGLAGLSVYVWEARKK